MHNYRLGLDIGTNSIGWAIFALNAHNRPCKLLDGGVRIYSDGRNPKDKQSLAVARREARSARKRRDRFLRRRNKLLRVLTTHGLLPTISSDLDTVFDPKSSDPYAIRAKGLDEKISLHELGRAIFHLNQRRGFKSNRKSDKSDDQESGKIKTAVNRLHMAISAAKARTLGEYLYSRRIKSLSVRVRMTALTADDNGKPKEGYDFYPDRALVEAEFVKLWDSQARFYPAELTEHAKLEIYDVLFFQRPLKPVRPGKCTFNPLEERLPKAHPLAQRIRIFQEVNNLRVRMDLKDSPPLTLDDRNKVVLALYNHKKLSFGRIRKLLKLSPNTSFNLESDTRKELEGELTTAYLSDDKRLGTKWKSLPLDQQIHLVDQLLSEQDEDRLIAWLMAEFSLSESQATATAGVNLSDGYSALGPTATAGILKELEAAVIPYSEACNRAGYHHSDFRGLELYDPETGEIYDEAKYTPRPELPYYGISLERYVAFGTSDPADTDEIRYGKIANPTVHIGLNQIRRLINALIKRYGHPHQIVVELARDLKLNKKQKEKLEREHKANKDRADRHRLKLEELKIPDHGENRMRLRLWEELNPSDPSNRRCPYTLEQISIEKLFTADVDIDHILPFSRTLDNSAANRTVCMAYANKAKGNKTPSEMWGNTSRWPEIIENAANLPRNKAWRFAEDSMGVFQKDRDFLDRQLVDTQYLSRISKEYLQGICHTNNIWVGPGRLTAMLRRLWGLDSILVGHNSEEPDNPVKNRHDHRHHIIDAITLGLLDRGILNRVSDEAARAEEAQSDRLLKDVPKPWDSLRDEVRSLVDRITVSHRPDHRTSGGRGRIEGYNQTSGRLHNDTAYGIVAGPDERGAYEVVHRIPYTSLKKPENLENIRDAFLKAQLVEATQGLDGKNFEHAMAQFAEEHPVFKGIRHVRVLETLTVIPIRNKRGKIYKAYAGGSNERFDVWQLPNGRWESEIVTLFDANQPNYLSKIRAEHHTAKKVMSLRQNDLLMWEDEGQLVIVRVIKFSINKTMQLAPHNEANVDARNRDKNDHFKYINTSASGLKNHKARQIRVDELGRVFDPGPRV